MKSELLTLPNINRVRGDLVHRGTSLAGWAKRNGYLPQYVDLSVRGKRRGPKARRIVAELKQELGL